MNTQRNVISHQHFIIQSYIVYILAPLKVFVFTFIDI